MIREDRRMLSAASFVGTEGSSNSSYSKANIDANAIAIVFANVSAIANLLVSSHAICQVLGEFLCHDCCFSCYSWKFVTYFSLCFEFGAV